MAVSPNKKFNEHDTTKNKNRPVGTKRKKVGSGHEQKGRTAHMPLVGQHHPSFSVRFGLDGRTWYTHGSQSLSLKNGRKRMFKLSFWTTEYLSHTSVRTHGLVLLLLV